MYELNNNDYDRYRNLLEAMGVGEEALDLYEYIQGQTMNNLNDILYVRFGYRDVSQLITDPQYTKIVLEFFPEMEGMEDD